MDRYSISSASWLEIFWSLVALFVCYLIARLLYYRVIYLAVLVRGGQDGIKRRIATERVVTKVALLTVPVIDLLVGINAMTVPTPNSGITAQQYVSALLFIIRSVIIALAALYLTRDLDLTRRELLRSRHYSSKEILASEPFIDAEVGSSTSASTTVTYTHTEASSDIDSTSPDEPE